MIITVKAKKIIMVIAAIALIAVVLGLGFGLNTAVATVNERKLPIYRVDRGEEKVVALSFDAAWGADKTQGIIDILNSNDIKATFFLVGFWIDKFEKEVRAIADNGMEIGNHSRNHLKMSTLSNEEIDKEITYVNDAVLRITGEKCKVFRAPFGDYNNTLMNRVESLGMTGIQWDVDSLDWKGISGEEISKRVLERVKPGSIVLFHNNSEHVLDALPVVIKKLKEDGYKFAKMSDIIHSGKYTIDNNGEQHKVEV